MPTSKRVRFASMVIVLTMAWAPRPAAQSAAADAPVRYVIGPEDVLDIAVWNNAALTRTVPVRPDGKISLPLVDDVKAAGLTPMELRDVLAERLSPYIPTAPVSVIVREIHSVKVSVIGHVKTPGRYELKDRATVLDVLAMAGGPNEYAARGRIVVLRQDGTTTRRLPFSYDRLADDNGSRPSQPNFCVQAGDVILVP